MQTLLSEIELFMDTHGLSHWQFGKLALGDKHFVRQLREGRDIRVSTEGRVRSFMLTYNPQREAA
jgi:hypothetical protein